MFAAAANAATVTGRVTDAETSTALPSMTVAAYTPGGVLHATATTDSAGRYNLTVVAGTYRVLAYDNAGVYATTFFNDADSFEATPNLVASGDVANVNFALRRGGTVSGTVSPATGSADGITVAAYNLNGTRRAFTQTNVTGAFNLVLAPGNYKLVAFDAGGTLWPEFYSQQPSFASANVLAVAAGRTTTIAFRLDVASHLIGSVVDVATNQSIADITVTAYEVSGNAISSAITDASGRFDVRAPAGSFRLVAADPKRAYATAYFGGTTFPGAPTIDVGAGQTRNNLRITMQRGGAITGRVTNSGAVPVGVTVAAYDRDGTLQVKTQSDASGNYVLVLPPGDYRIAAYDESLVYATQFYSAQNVFRFATPIHVEAGLTIAGINVALPRGARIAGSVLDSSTNVPVLGITVAAYDSNGDFVTSAATNGAGQYELVVPAGSYRLLAFDDALRYATAFAGGTSYENSPYFVERADSNERIDFRITRGVRVTGSVTDAAGVGLSGISITALDASGNRVGSAATNRGTFQIVLLPERYRFLASDPQARYAAAYSASSVVVSAGANPSVSFVLAPLQRRRSAPH
jgi:hypothetical protein